MLMLQDEGRAGEGCKAGKFPPPTHQTMTLETDPLY